MFHYPDEVFIVVEPPDARARRGPKFESWTELAACDVRPGDWVSVTERMGPTSVRLDTRWALVAYVTNEWSHVRVGDRVCGYPRLELVSAVPGEWGRPPESSVALPAITYRQEADR